MALRVIALLAPFENQRYLPCGCRMYWRPDAFAAFDGCVLHGRGFYLAPWSSQYSMPCGCRLMRRAGAGVEFLACEMHAPTFPEDAPIDPGAGRAMETFIRAKRRRG
jgi:hypothetical protein